MLTFRENWLNFRAFKILSNLCLLPIEMNEKSGKIRIQSESNKIRAVGWRILFSVAVTHCCYMVGRLVQSTMVEPEKYFRWDHFVLHLPFAFAYSVFYFTGYSMFVQNPGELVMIFNQLFVERENPVQKMMDEELENKLKHVEETSFGGKAGTEVVSASVKIHVQVSDRDGIRIRPLLAWPPLYSLDELLARYLQFALFMAASLALVVLAVDPQRPQLLYSALPPEYQNVYSFLGLFSVEIISITVIIVSAFFSVVTEVLFFQKCQSELQRLNLQVRTFVEAFQRRPLKDRDIGREIWILRQILDEMKELVVFMELFNRCFPFIIFAFKITCLLAAIFFYFFTIRHGRDFPLLGVFTGYAAVGITVCYTIQYQNAFSIPGNMEQLKMEFLQVAQKTSLHSKSTSAPENANTNSRKSKSRIFWADMKREVGRIRDVGVKVGNFHSLERESTPNFINFVVNQVVSLLVTFPR